MNLPPIIMVREASPDPVVGDGFCPAMRLSIHCGRNLPTVGVALDKGTLLRIRHHSPTFLQ